VAKSGLCCGCHTARDRYYLVGGIMSGAVVSWLTRLLDRGDEPDALAALMEEAASAPMLSGDIWFLPYLGGSGPPDRDPNAWGAWLGLRLNHGRGDLVRAAMEGLCFALRYLLEGHQRITGDPIRALRAVGGGTRNIWWQRLKADVLGLTIEVPDVSEVTARGAALLAGIAVGVYGDAAEAAARAYRPDRRYQPDNARHEIYDAAYQDVFLGLYPTLRVVPLSNVGKA
jgi:xylulokinase